MFELFTIYMMLNIRQIMLFDKKNINFIDFLSFNCIFIIVSFVLYCNQNHFKNKRDKMLIQELQLISKSFESLQKFCGFSFVWHFVNTDLLLNICPSQNDHQHPYCIAIKKTREFNKCLKTHNDIIFKQALFKREPFIFCCHAGVRELAVPLFSKDSFLGILFVGTFTSTAGHRKPILAKEYASMIKIDDTRLLEFGKFIEQIIEPLLINISDKIQEQFPSLLPSPETADYRILNILKFMRLNFKKKIMAQDMAQKTGLSTSRFLHLFPSEVGFTFSDWLQRLRINEARRLIEGTDISIGLIAESCCFSDQSRLATLCRRYFDEPPRSLRSNTYKKNNFA
jgi:AraC-like DNA-binding protein